jgi:hypothetical protein
VGSESKPDGGAGASDGRDAIFLYKPNVLNILHAKYTKTLHF